MLIPTEEDLAAPELDCMNTYSTWGQDFMDCMLLSQYQNSPLLKKYIRAFIEEFDILFEEAQKVQLGRYIDCATGAQLDIIGDIIGQPRTLIIPKEFFGFEGAEIAASFGTLPNAAVGGYWKSLQDAGSFVDVLVDERYRRVLKLRAYCLGTTNRVMDLEEGYSEYRHAFSADDLYKSISIYVVGHTDILSPQLVTGMSTTDTSVDITVSALQVSDTDVATLILLRGWYMPFGFELNITRA